MKSFKVGSIVLATEQGLGYLARDFYKNGILDKVYIHEHSSRTNHREWYPRESVVASIEQLVEECDVLLFFETPFHWKVIPQAREKGKKTVLMPMYECTQYPNPYSADLILSPSELDRNYYPGSTLVTVPVSVPWRQRTHAQVFVHNAGNGGLGGRNGTKQVLEAMQYVKSPLKLIVRTQGPLQGLDAATTRMIEEDDRIEIRHGTFEDIWSEGDVFLFPEKFNGLSLPLQEAYASGMLVMAGNRFPINTWLPTNPLIPEHGSRTERIATEFISSVFDPKDIALHMDIWFNKDITDLSLRGKAWGEEHSWTKLKESFEGLMSPLSAAQGSSAPTSSTIS